MKDINLQDIRVDRDTQSRVALNEVTVADYAEAIKSGATLPAVVVFFDKVDHWLADGFHRFHAYREAGLESIPADIRPGSKRDAVLFSVSANAEHGLRRTNEDKRRAVQLLLEDAEWSKWSNREIADRCSVSHNFVSEVRRSLESDDSEKPDERVYTTKHGTRATMKTGAIGKPPKAAQAAPKDTPAASVPEPTADDELAEPRHTIALLSAENEELRAKLAVEQMDVSEEEKTAAAELIATLRAEVKTQTADLDAMRVSRDSFQAENAELKKQIATQQRKLKAKAPA